MSILINTPDTYRAAIESASQGENTVLYDDHGYPSVMLVVPRFNLDTIDPAWPATPHPAFLAGGTVKEVIYVAKYQAAVLGDQAVSMPDLPVKRSCSFDSALEYCSRKGSGWHLMSNAEWAALALRRWGPSENPRDDTGFSFGLWEWVGGLRLSSGEIQVIEDVGDGNVDQGAESSSWRAVQQDGSLVAPGAPRTLKFNQSPDGPRLATAISQTRWAHRRFKSLSAERGVKIPDRLKHLLIYPHAGLRFGAGEVYVDNDGERLPFRGGLWHNGSVAGVFSLHLSGGRSYTGWNFGFRPAFC